MVIYLIICNLMMYEVIYHGSSPNYSTVMVIYHDKMVIVM